MTALRELLRALVRRPVFGDPPHWTDLGALLWVPALVAGVALWWSLS